MIDKRKPVEIPGDRPSQPESWSSLHGNKPLEPVWFEGESSMRYTESYSCFFILWTVFAEDGCTRWL